MITTQAGTGGDSVEYLDLGMATQASGRSNSSRMVRATRSVTLYVARASGIAGGTATLNAAVRDMDASVHVRINGVEIGSVPRTIDSRVSIGRAWTIRVEVDVAAEAPEGISFLTLDWDASSNP